jgi:hypothetical protein
MEREITAIKVIKWLDTKRDKTFYGLDCRVNDMFGWFHLKDNDGPLWYSTRKAANEARKEMLSNPDREMIGIMTKTSAGRILNLRK